MISITKYTKIEDLQAVYERLYQECPVTLTPFSSYIFNYYSLRALRWRFRGYELSPILYYCTEDKNEAIFLFVKNIGKHELATISAYSPVDYSELITNSNDIRFIKEAIVQIYEMNAGYTIRFDAIHEGSLLHKALKEVPAIEQNCVKIDITSYDQYYSQLSKHQRQNLRTGYNRLSNANMSHELKKITAPFPKEVIKNYKSLFFERRLQRIQPEMKLKTKFKLFYYALCVRFRDPIVPSLKHQNPDLVTFQYYIGSIMRAFVLGLYSHDKKSFYIVNLVYSKKHSQLSPGILMLNEVVKVLAEEGGETIDLTRGDEPYKLAMGGKVHYNYSFTLNDETIKKIQ